jgi:nicotinamidase-related amidase
MYHQETGMGRIWDDVIPEHDREIIGAAGYGARGEFGKRPALLIVDVSYDFTGDRAEPILESVKRFHNSCGEGAWKAVSHIEKLLEVARSRQVPTFYTTGLTDPNPILRGAWVWKNPRGAFRARSEISKQIGQDIVKEIAPIPGDVVIAKVKPTAFYGTPLGSYLQLLGIDNLIICGTTTSGCVRASVIEAFNLNFHIQVVEECTFDRIDISHKINLFDMNAKYADVLPLAEISDYIANLPADVYNEIERYRLPQVAPATR